MKYIWFEENKTCEELGAELGCTVKSIKKGGIIVGYEDGFEDGELVQVPIVKQGIEIELENEDALAISRLDQKIYPLKRTGEPIIMPKSMHIAALKNVSLVNGSPRATIIRKYLGQSYEITNCHVSQTAYDNYQAGKIKVYDDNYGINEPQNADCFTLVSFISENPSNNEIEIPILIDKAIK